MPAHGWDGQTWGQFLNKTPIEGRSGMARQDVHLWEFAFDAPSHMLWRPVDR
jgi:hypothetical protein